MVKILVNSQGKFYKTSGGKALLSSGGGGNEITAINNSSAAVTSGDKVWIEKVGSSYNIKDFYGTAQNFTTQGSPTISNKVVSGFSTSNYIYTNSLFNLSLFDSWEVYTMVNLTSIESQYFFDFREFSGVLGLNDAGKIIYYASSTSNTWNISNGTTGTTTLTTNKDDYIRLVFDGTSYKCYLSETGAFAGEETTEFTINSSTKAMDSKSLVLGCQNIANAYYMPLKGSMDLSKTYAKVNGTLYWTPYFSNINEDSLTGVAQENIAIGSSGSVITVLPEE